MNRIAHLHLEELRHSCDHIPGGRGHGRRGFWSSREPTEASRRRDSWSGPYEGACSFDNVSGIERPCPNRITGRSPDIAAQFLEEHAQFVPGASSVANGNAFGDREPRLVPPVFEVDRSGPPGNPLNEGSGDGLKIDEMFPAGRTGMIRNDRE